MTKYFKVWVGYDHPIRITDKEYPTALEAHLTGKVAVINGISISGKSITLIEPDYHRALGWNDNYRYGNQDDRLQIEREAPGYEEFMLDAGEEVRARLSGHELPKRIEIAPAPVDTSALAENMRIK